MSGSLTNLNALMTPTLPGITTPPVTNTLAPPTLPGAGAAMASAHDRRHGRCQGARTGTAAGIHPAAALCAASDVAAAAGPADPAAGSAGQGAQDQQDWYQNNSNIHGGSEGGGGGAEGTM